LRNTVQVSSVTLVTRERSSNIPERHSEIERTRTRFTELRCFGVSSHFTVLPSCRQCLAQDW
jgi:hypothetical protein